MELPILRKLNYRRYYSFSTYDFLFFALRIGLHKIFLTTELFYNNKLYSIRQILYKLVCIFNLFTQINILCTFLRQKTTLKPPSPSWGVISNRTLIREETRIGIKLRSIQKNSHLTFSRDPVKEAFRANPLSNLPSTSCHFLEQQSS